MFDQTIFLQHFFGNEPGKIIAKTLEVASGGKCFIKNHDAVLNGTEDEFVFSGDLKLSFDTSDKKRKKIFIDNEGVSAEFHYDKNGKPLYLGYRQETADSGVIDVNLFGDGDGSLFYYNDRTCAMGNLDYMSNFVEANNQGFLPDYSFIFSGKRKNSTEYFLDSLKRVKAELGRIIPSMGSTGRS